MSRPLRRWASPIPPAVRSPPGRRFTPRAVRCALMLLAMLLTWAGIGAKAAIASGQACAGSPSSVLPIDLQVQGQDAKGLYVLPAQPPRTLVVFGHGYSYNDTAWVAHMANAAAIDGALSVTMNYRGLTDMPKDGTGYERSRGWPVKAGSEDLVAAARYFDATCGPFDRILLLGVSMGGNSSGLAAAAQAKRIDGQPLFDYWVGIEGVYNLTELYQEATAVGPTNQFAAQAKSDIEAETGGTYAQVPQAYSDRTVVNQAGRIAASGLKGVYVIHATQDGEAAYNQAQEMTTNLRNGGLPTDLYTVTRHAPGDDPNIDTTLPGAPPGFAGHEAEWSTHDVVLDVGFDRLTALLVRGEPPPCNRDFTVDGMASPEISPDPAMPAAGCPAGKAVGPGNASSGGLGTANGAPVAGCSAGPRLSVAVIRGRRRLLVHGGARPSRCAAHAARVSSVSVALARPLGTVGRCRFVRPTGRLSKSRSCARPIFMRARGTTRWRRRVRRPVRGTYRLTVVLRETSGPALRVDRRLSVR